MKVTRRVSAIILFVLGALALSGCNLNGGGNGGTTYAIGDTGPSGVGIVFYVSDDGLHGLEVAPVDQNGGNKIQWSDVLDKEIGTTGTGIGTGSANTDAIIAQSGHNTSAAQEARDYRAAEEGDWFLPSKDELNAIWDNLVDDGTGGNNGVGGFADDHYWSSSESSSDKAVNQDFTNGLQYSSSGKNFYARVRAVRAF
jgi:hypothetical protein